MTSSNNPVTLTPEQEQHYQNEIEELGSRLYKCVCGA